MRQKESLINFKNYFSKLKYFPLFLIILVSIFGILLLFYTQKEGLTLQRRIQILDLAYLIVILNIIFTVVSIFIRVNIWIKLSIFLIAVFSITIQVLFGYLYQIY